MDLEFINSVVESISRRAQKVLDDTPAPVLSVSSAVAASFLVWRLTRPIQEKPSNLPPAVPYMIPYVGNGFELQRDPQKFIRKCKEKYGPVFQIYSFGRTMVVATGECITECFRLGDRYLDFTTGVQDVLPLDRIIAISYDKQKRQDVSQVDSAKSPLVRTVRNNFKSHQLKLFEERMEYAVNKGLQLDLHFAPGAKTAKLRMDDVQQMVARISGLVFAGDEVGENRELVTAMATYAQSIFSAAIFYMVLPVRLADIAVRHYLNVGKQIAITMKYMTPVLSKVKKQEDEEGKLNPTFFMHMMLHTPNADGSDPSPEDAAFWLQDITFASIHTTSLFVTWSLHLLSDRPDVQELVRQETEAAKKKHGHLSPTAVRDMPIIDSIFREALRLNGDYVGINHKAVQDTVLSNGILIPKGMSVGMAVNDAHTDPNIQDIGENNIPLNEFDPRRHIARKTKKSTAIGLDLLTFGMGYHACPGRYFASQEICYMLAKILENYDITPNTADGKRARNRLALGLIQLPPTEGVLLTKRS